MKRHEAVVALVEEFLQNQQSRLDELRSEIHQVNEGELSDSLKEKLIMLQEYFGGFGVAPKKKPIIQEYKKPIVTRRNLKEEVIKESNDEYSPADISKAKSPVSQKEMSIMQSKLDQLKKMKGIE